jgi:hypothetical protein
MEGPRRRNQWGKGIGNCCLFGGDPDGNGNRSVDYSYCTDSRGKWGSSSVVLTGMELVNFGQYSNVATLAALVKNDRGVVSNRLYYCLRSDHVNEDRFFFAGAKRLTCHLRRIPRNSLLYLCHTGQSYESYLQQLIMRHNISRFH